MAPPNNPTQQRKRLLYRSQYRGTKEMDLILSAFAITTLPHLHQPSLDDYEAILKLPEPILHDWLIHNHPIPASQQTPILLALREFARTETATLLQAASKP